MLTLFTCFLLFCLRSFFVLRLACAQRGWAKINNVCFFEGSKILRQLTANQTLKKDVLGAKHTRANAPANTPNLSRQRNQAFSICWVVDFESSAGSFARSPRAVCSMPSHPLRRTAARTGSLADLSANATQFGVPLRTLQGRNIIEKWTTVVHQIATDAMGNDLFEKSSVDIVSASIVAL